MTFLASACQEVEQKFKLRCVSTEYEIMLLLYELNVASPSELVPLQHGSSSTFFRCIDDLHQKGLLRVERDAQDRRHSLYSLTDFARSVLDEKWSKIQSWTRERPAVAFTEAAGNGMANGAVDPA